MIGRAPKGLWPAVTDIERVAFSRLRLYEHYERDDRLRDALVQFHGEWWTGLGRSLRRLDECLLDLDDAERRLADLVGPELAHDYLADLGALAAEAGLDRIPMIGTPLIAGYLPSGIAQAHRYLWRLDKALLWEAAPVEAKASLPPVRRPTFLALGSFGASIPAVDTAIAGTAARWDPRTEHLADARRRLRSETDLTRETIEAELIRIGKEGGYQFPDTSTQRGGIGALTGTPTGPGGVSDGVGPTPGSPRSGSASILVITDSSPGPTTSLESGKPETRASWGVWKTPRMPAAWFGKRSPHSPRGLEWISGRDRAAEPVSACKPNRSTNADVLMLPQSGQLGEGRRIARGAGSISGNSEG